MGHVTPAPGTNQRRGRPGGHGGTHPVRLLEMLLCPIVGLWGALVAPIRAPLQRGRWPRSVCPPPLQRRGRRGPAGSRELGEQPVHGAAWGPTGGRGCVSRPLPHPHPQAVASTIQSHRLCPDAVSPGLGCNPRPLRSPLAPPRALEPRPHAGARASVAARGARGLCVPGA